jgi:ketosteroid isomerase-like protein
MSEQNIGTVVKGFELWNLAMVGDNPSWRTALQEMIDQYHPDAELDYRRTLPDFTPTRGTEAIIVWTEGARQAFGDVRIEPKDYIEAGGSIVVPVRMVARGALSGAEAVANFVYVFRFRSQLIVSATSFKTVAEAFKAAGPAEHSGQPSAPLRGPRGER